MFGDPAVNGRDEEPEPQPFCFAGLSLGSAKEEVEKQFVFTQYVDNEGAACTSGSIELMIEGVQIMAFLSFERQRGLQVIDGGFPSTHFAGLRAGFIRRFDAPDDSALVEPGVRILPAGTDEQNAWDPTIPVNSLLWYKCGAFVSLQDRHNGFNFGHLRVATYRYMKKSGGNWKMSGRARQALVSAREIVIPPLDWAQEPCAFEGLKFGMSLDEVTGMIELRERIALDYINTAYEVRLNIDSIEAVGRLDFHADRLVMVSGEFNIADWGSFKEIFVRRYGVPHYHQEAHLEDGCLLEEFYWSSDRITVGLSGVPRREGSASFHLGPSSDTHTQHLKRQHQ
jgi:hypothetical protein